MIENKVKIEVDAIDHCGVVWVSVFALMAEDGHYSTPILAYTDRSEAEDVCKDFLRVRPERPFRVVEIRAYVKERV